MQSFRLHDYIYKTQYIAPLRIKVRSPFQSTYEACFQEDNIFGLDLTLQHSFQILKHNTQLTMLSKSIYTIFKLSQGL